MNSIAYGPSALSPQVLAAEDRPMPKPGAGMQFVLVKFSITNLSHRNDVWTADSATSANVGEDTYSAAVFGPVGDAADAYNAQSENESSAGPNPNASGVDYAVYEIPANVKPTSISVANGTALQTIDGLSGAVLVTLDR